MTSGKIILGLVGSPRTDGLTNRLVTSALDGAVRAGAATELVQMSEYVVDACKDCLPWVCADNLKCTYPDEGLEVLSQKLLACDGLVLGAPVYWGDTTSMVRQLILKIFRIYARTQPTSGLPAFGIAIAGGTGNGLLSGLRPLYHFFRIMWMRGVEPLPVTRFDLEVAVKKAEEAGYSLAKMDKEKFNSRDERDYWYDNLPYLGDSNAKERRLLAALSSKAVPADKLADVKGSWEQADILAASGKKLEAMTETSRIIDSASEKIPRG